VITATKPGSATQAIPGVEAKVLDAEGEPIAPGGPQGLLALTKPWPGMLRTLYGDAFLADATARGIALEYLVLPDDPEARLADELAARFEDYEPSDAQELDPAAVALLRAAVQERSAAERHIIEAISTARAAGMSWSALGSLVGTSGEAARQRYADNVA
jgi:hypothetical protein